jgi:hypothetical protein
VHPFQFAHPQIFFTFPVWLFFGMVYLVRFESVELAVDSGRPQHRDCSDLPSHDKSQDLSDRDVSGGRRDASLKLSLNAKRARLCVEIQNDTPASLHKGC